MFGVVLPRDVWILTRLRSRDDGLSDLVEANIHIMDSGFFEFVHDFALETSGILACSGPLSEHKRYCPYLEETCTPEPAFVYISTNEDDDYPEEEPISNKGSETHDDVADSEDLSKSNYNADSCEVVQDDDTVGSYSETVTVATVDGNVGRSAITSTLVRIQLQLYRGPMRRYV
ncbi:hypothetical protein ACOSQ4_024227 [Xanthoceras sorbifolium]